jgi:hypothetical protein
MKKYPIKALLFGLLLLLTFYTFSNQQFHAEVVSVSQETRNIVADDRIIDYTRYKCDSIKR